MVGSWKEKLNDILRKKLIIPYEVFAPTQDRT